MTNDVPPSSNIPPDEPVPVPPVPNAPVPPMSVPPAGTPVTTPGDRIGLAIASLVLGILSLCGSVSLVCGGLLSIIAIILGFLGINSRGRVMAIIGIVLGVIGLLATIILRIIFRGAFLNNFWQQYLPGGSGSY